MYHILQKLSNIVGSSRKSGHIVSCWPDKYGNDIQNLRLITGPLKKGWLIDNNFHMFLVLIRAIY